MLAFTMDGGQKRGYDCKLTTLPPGRSRLQQTCHSHQVATNLGKHQACCDVSFTDLLKQLVASLWITSFVDN